MSGDENGISGDERNVRLSIGIDGGYSHWSEAEIDARTDLGAAVTRFEWDPGTPLEESEETLLAAVENRHPPPRLARRQ